MLAEVGAPIDAVVSFEVPRDELVRRVAGRQGLISMVTDPVDAAVVRIAGHGRLSLGPAVAHGHEQLDHGFLEEGRRGVDLEPLPLLDVLLDLRERGLVPGVEVAVQAAPVLGAGALGQVPSSSGNDAAGRCNRHRRPVQRAARVFQKSL